MSELRASQVFDNEGEKKVVVSRRRRRVDNVSEPVKTETEANVSEPVETETEANVSEPVETETEVTEAPTTKPTAPTRRRRNVNTEKSEETEKNEETVEKPRAKRTAKRTAKKTASVVNERQTAPGTESTDEETRYEPPKYKKTASKDKGTPLYYQYLVDLLKILDDKTISVSARRKIIEKLHDVAPNIVEGLRGVRDDCYSLAWQTNEKKPRNLAQDVVDFLNAVEWGPSYTKKAEKKAKIEYIEGESLAKSLYCVKNGVANSIILARLAKLYVILNPDMKIEKASDSEKKSPQSSVKATDLMMDYLGAIMDAIAAKDEEENQKKLEKYETAKKEGKEPKTKDGKDAGPKLKVKFDPSNIPRQQLSKILAYEATDYVEEGDAAVVVQGLSDDEQLLNATIEYYEKQRIAKNKASAKEVVEEYDEEEE